MQSQRLDDGTLCRAPSPLPQVTGKNALSLPAGADPKLQARHLIDLFVARSGAGAFPNIHRLDVATGLAQRIEHPSMIDQANSSLCGAAALMRALTKEAPVRYVTYVIELYENGFTQLGQLKIQPRQGARTFKPSLQNPDGERIAPVDWIALASIRDSENSLLFPYDSPKKEAAGITPPWDVARWFQQIGYRQVIDATTVNPLRKLGKADIDTANGYWTKGFYVLLLINDNMLHEKTQDSISVFPTHWVVLNSPIKVFLPPINQGEECVSFVVYTWGQEDYQVPSGVTPLTRTGFFHNYYGCLACAM